MATFNLVRNSKVFFTTNVDATTGVIPTSGFSTANTQEIQVLDGFTFSQATNADTVQISEAGSTPVRGQRAFNTSLNNVEFSFSTYLRPRLNTTIFAEESVLWNALFSDSAIATAQTLTGQTSATYATATGLLTITGAAMTWGTVAVGDIGVLSGLTGTGASQANVPVKVTAKSATTMDCQLLSAYASTLTLSTGAVKLNYSAWVPQAAVATDATYGNVPYSMVSSAMSNKNKLQTFGMIFNVDGITYLVDNCAMDQASIDFSLDGIATVAWTGKGTAIKQTTSAVTYVCAVPGTNDTTMSVGLTGTAAAKSLTAKYITNKLSTVSLVSKIGGIAGTSYTLALTGGNITVANNISYVVPANLGVVNIPIGYFTGARAVSGNITAYLRTGTLNTAGLLADMLNNASTSVDPKFQLKVDIGGASNTLRVETTVYGAMLQIPTVDAQAVMSTTINFTAQGTGFGLVTAANEGYDIENTNDLLIRYFAPA